MLHIFCFCQIFRGGSTITVNLRNLCISIYSELLRIAFCSLVNGNNGYLIVITLICRHIDIVCRLFRSIDPHIAGTNIFGVLCHAVPTLADLSVFRHQTIIPADIPPGICTHIAHNHGIMNIFRNLQCLRITICRILVAVGNIDFCHPDFFSAVFQIRKVHPRTLGAVKVRTKQVTVCHCLAVIQDLPVKFLAAVRHP